MESTQNRIKIPVRLLPATSPRWDSIDIAPVVVSGDLVWKEVNGKHRPASHKRISHRDPMTQISTVMAPDDHPWRPEDYAYH